MSEKLQAFDRPEFDESLAKEEVYTYHPHSKSFEANDEGEITIPLQNALIVLADANLHIEGRFEPEAEGDGQCKLSNNAPLHCFDWFSYELDDKEIEKVRNPGLLTAIRGLTGYTANASKSLTMAGWNPTTNTPVTLSADGKKFWFWIPLSFLFSVFYDCKHFIYGRHKFRWVRSNTDDNAYITTGGDRKAKITITNMSLKVKHIVPNDRLRLQLLQRLHSNKPLTVSFRKWELFELPALKDGAKDDSWPVKTTSVVERPRYQIVAFQTDRRNNHKADSTKFDNIDLRLYRGKLNNLTFPHEDHNLDFPNNQYLSAYHAYVNFSNEFCETSPCDSQVVVDYQSFKESYPLFVIDCSKQEEALQSNNIAVTVDYESHNIFPRNTRMYNVIISDKVFQYTPMDHQVNKLI